MCIFCGLGSSGWPEIRTNWKIWKINCGSDETLSALWCLWTETCLEGKKDEWKEHSCQK